MRDHEVQEKKVDISALEMSDLSSGLEEEKDDHDDEKKSHPAIIHSLIDDKEELLKAVFFSDMPKVFSFFEKSITDAIPIDIKPHLRLAIQQNDLHISHLLTLPYSQEKRSPNAYHFRLLLACIFHNKPKLFEYLLMKLNASEFSNQQTLQFYWLALHLKQENFCKLLQKQGVQPIPGVIRLAYLYKVSLKVTGDLWESLSNTEKWQVFHWIQENSEPTQKLENLRLPESMRKWVQELREISEIKTMPRDQIAVLSVSPYPLTVPELNTLAERQEYTRIIMEMPGDFFQAIYKEIKEYALGKPNKTQTAHIIEWIHCLYGSPVTAAQTFLQDPDLLRAPPGLHFCLSLHNQCREYPLPVQWLTAAFLENQPLEMPAFRGLRHLTNILDDDSKELQGFSSDAWNRNELLEGERLYIKQLIKPLTLQDDSGDLTQEIVTRLGLPVELILEELPIPLPVACQQIILEYLFPAEQKNLQIQYPGLNPASMLRKQIETLMSHLEENRNIISRLETLIRYPETWKRWIKKNFHHLMGGTLSVAGIISLPLNRIARNRYNTAIINQLPWQECMNQGYQLERSFFGLGVEVCNKKAIPDPAIPECNVLCDELFNEPTGMLVWFALSLILIFTPLWILMTRELIGCIRKRYCPRPDSENIIPDDLNNRIDQHYRNFNKRPPLKIEARSAAGVGLFISNLTARQSGLQTSLDKLESKQQRPSLTPIIEEQEQPSHRETKAKGMTDLFKPGRKAQVGLSQPLLSLESNF